MNISLHSELVDPTRPRYGYSVAGAVARLSRAMIAAVDALENALPSDARLTFLSSGAELDRAPDISPRRRAAWAVAATYALKVFVSGELTSVSAALNWFGYRAPRFEDEDAVNEAEMFLSTLCADPAARELFPYVLDTFGPTSRLDVMRDSALRPKRAARKHNGVFYTPSDVADFMVESIAGTEPFRGTWLDPACGSGIFLLAVLRHCRRSASDAERLIEFATTRLHGLDISPQACDFAAFALCGVLLQGFPGSPVELWVRLRRNIVAADALRVISPSERKDRGSADSLKKVFRREIEAPLRLICNPPYTRSTALVASTQSGASGSIYLRFVEMAWRISTSERDQAALVVPLAFAANRSTSHSRCRAALTQHPGAWTMLFFDRQPHALFGEDAKTRNAILIRRASPDFAVRTSGLLKWTSRQRGTIFSDARAVALGHSNIQRLVPKLGSASEVSLYEALTAYRLRSAERPSICSIDAGKIAETATDMSLFAGGTAYNFINVFRDYPAPDASGRKFSNSKVHRLDFETAQKADVGFALIASGVFFWLWHVECDGFHLPRWCLEESPLFDLVFDMPAQVRLGRLWVAIWRALKRDLLASNNAGRWTFSFRPTGAQRERDEIDQIILQTVGRTDVSIEALRKFEKRTVLIDGQSRVARNGEYERRISRSISK